MSPAKPSRKASTCTMPVSSPWCRKVGLWPTLTAARYQRSSTRARARRRRRGRGTSSRSRLRCWRSESRACVRAGSRARRVRTSAAGGRGSRAPPRAAPRAAGWRMRVELIGRPSGARQRHDEGLEAGLRGRSVAAWPRRRCRRRRSGSSRRRRPIARRARSRRIVAQNASGVERRQDRVEGAGRRSRRRRARR